MALDALIAAVAAVVEYRADPLRTFPTDDPYVRRAEFGRLSTPLSRSALGLKQLLQVSERDAGVGQDAKETLRGGITSRPSFSG